MEKGNIKVVTQLHNAFKSATYNLICLYKGEKLFLKLGVRV